ncbi:hypothetical protein LEP1GSC087_3541 [Leptospira interrogans serovar Bataviae str. L1111]|nr:hypothetical protein LEP1GSC087_3541 [Leptospira interrogans serovar Bataviae str. L1111]EMN71747.1 hypothetical protein LEP1GSC100_4572 [Leptospira interrogans serovar Bataviae str. UI 08561]
MIESVLLSSSHRSLSRYTDLAPNLEPLRMFEILEKNENFGGKHEETF